jgi:hypothetical protein
MATIEQMAGLSTPFVTSQGATYKLPPLNLITRRRAIAFVELAQQIQIEGGNETEQANKLIDALVDLVLAWYGRVDKTLTREQIEEDFDVVDIAPLMQIVRGMESELQASVPPVSSAPKRTTTNKRK